MNKYYVLYQYYKNSSDEGNAYVFCDTKLDLNIEKDFLEFINFLEEETKSETIIIKYIKKLDE